MPDASAADSSAPVCAPDPLAENFALCHECGGLCCCLYLAHDEDGTYIGDGWLPDYIEEWLGKFVASGALVRDGDAYVGGAGVQPLHDPRLSHLPTPEGEAYRATLPTWVDTRKCQFCHPDTGCMLPHERRAPICDSYHCELWPEVPLPDSPDALPLP
jgi:hypothetical protein